MHDPRITRLAEVLIDHSCRLQTGEKVLIEAFDLPETQLVCRAGAAWLPSAGPCRSSVGRTIAVLRALYTHGTRERISLIGELERQRMRQMDCYIGIRGAANSSQFSDVPRPQMDLYQECWWKPVHSEIRVPKTRWVVLRYPTDSFAQAARMSSEAFEDFFFAVCTADYAAMARHQEPLRARMDAADQVRITGRGTELTFSIKGIPVVPCNGERNIPDGEVFTAPVKTSVNGVITLQRRVAVPGDGVRRRAVRVPGRQDREGHVRQRDREAQQHPRFRRRCPVHRRVRIGCNNFVRRPMLDTLFDEKIGGSIHFTPGQAYEEADNGNRSRVHWDLVFIQTPEYGGGEIYFDGQLLRKDGRFMPGDLQPLNVGL